MINESFAVTFDPDRFESLGGNCEFGFFLQDRGNGQTSLLKWAEVIGIEGLTQLLRNDFAGMFAYENVVPFNANMVLDQTHWIAWHSKFQAEAADPEKPFSRMNAKFTTPEPERRALWEDQNDKLQHFVTKLRAGLRSGERIFVYKPRVQDTVKEDELAALSEAMRSYGPNTLLAVTIAERPDDVGTVRAIRPGLLRGRIDRFAPGDRANDYSGEVWARLCEAALDHVDTADAAPAGAHRTTHPAEAARGFIAGVVTQARRWMERR